MSAPYEGDSTTSVPGIKGTSTSANGVGAGVLGENNAVGGYGVLGWSDLGHGVRGLNDITAGGSGTQPDRGTGVSGDSANGYGVLGTSRNWEGVRGIGHGRGAGVAGFNDAPDGSGQPGVWGESQHWEGVHGIGHGKGAGVAGFNDAPDGVAQPGVWGESQHWEGVHGLAHNKGAGVAGFNLGPPAAAAHGVWGESQNWEGVHGVGHGSGAGVAGFNDAPVANAQPGVWGESKNGEGVHGVSHTPSAAAIAGFGAPGGLAGYFAGNVTVTGDVFLSGADCAEHFDIANADRVEPGTVMALADDGRLQESRFPYDKRVAGVISGAGSYKPGIVLDRRESQPNRKPIALVGKAYCKADAQYGAIEIGDLLTTSSTPGHAMRATDQSKAFGTIIGKALAPLAGGQGLIPVLIALQ